MPRRSRVVIPGIPHHVIQRGARSLPVFFAECDRAFYLNVLREHIKEACVEIWAYCLMTNHVHFVAVPREKDSLARAFAETHRVYTRWVNLRKNWRGYLWQGRFKSYPLDEYRQFVAVRYIELNPVRANIVASAGEYAWSSARAHLLGDLGSLLTMGRPLESIKDWREFLEIGIEDSELLALRKHIQTGLPLGSEEFVSRLEAETGRVLHERKKGRKVQIEAWGI